MSTWRDVVRLGYDSVSLTYRGDTDSPPKYQEWIDELARRLPTVGAAVLDLGCGCGVPVARDLAGLGHHVTGVDTSPVQIARARELVPDATFHEADLVDVSFGPESFDAIVCLYALIHLPDREQWLAVGQIATWLRAGGTFLATVGAEAATDSDPDWLGTGTTMWWNHPDPRVLRGWLERAGLDIDVDRFVPEGRTGHQLIVATRRTG